MEDLFNQALLRFDTWLFLLVATTGLVQIGYFIIRSRKDTAVSYRISVIGLPRAGKTALISALFEHVFLSTEGRAFAPVGEKTINKVNDQIALLNSRSTFSKTRDDEIFIFRFLYHVRNLFLFAKVRYEGEIVDFPGEMSGDLFDSVRDGAITDDIAIFNKEFYSWILSSKVHIFVIDSSKFLLSSNKATFASTRSSEIRKTWQILNEEINRSQRASDSRVAIVFTKSDIAQFVPDASEQPDSSLVNQFSVEEVPPADNLDYKSNAKISHLQDDTKKAFKNLFSYFKNQQCEFEVFFTSAYTDKDGRRLGIADLTNFVLPKGNFH